MLVLQNDHVNDMVGPIYKEVYVRQIVDGRDSIFNEMFQNVNIYRKEKLDAWLKTVSNMTKENLD